ncbi:MAG: 3-isopropylmalate dehydrogenase [Symbiobacteriaceae bacterium]|jgi:3-isopropylmalate dehydrogenase|nr:3-isopropylmalate dehydrogenase [Symbiobacteriaceae bacterium]
MMASPAPGAGARPLKIAVFAGDGIGPEVMAEAVKVLKAVESRFGLAFELTHGLVGGAAYDATGHPLPPETIALARSSDAVLFGAVGGDQWDHLPLHLRPEAAILGLRKAFDLYANLRPSVTHRQLLHRSPLKAEILGDGVDLLIVRELTGGLYFGQPKGQQVYEGVERTVDTLVYTDAEIERVARLAFDLARARARRLCSVDKANVLATGRRWREVVTRVAADYPDVALSHMYVDNCAMQLIRNPRQFDVIVTENTFGDILTDESSTIPGSIGLLPSASVGAGGLALYEPIHGSAPDIAGQGKANPLATILCVAMMLRTSFGQEEAARAVEEAVSKVLDLGYRTPDLLDSGCETVGTVRMGDLVAAQI